MDEFNPMSEYESIETENPATNDSGKTTEVTKSVTDNNYSTVMPNTDNSSVYAKNTQQVKTSHVAATDPVPTPDPVYAPNGTYPGTPVNNGYAPPAYPQHYQQSFQYPNTPDPRNIQQNNFGAWQQPMNTTPEYQQQYTNPAQPGYQSPQGFNPYVNQQPSPFVPNGQNQAVRYQKPKTPTGTKIFITILFVLLFIFVAGFVACCVYFIDGDQADNTSETQFIIDDMPNGIDGYPDQNGGNNSDDDINNYFDGMMGLPSYESQTYEEEITLMEDKGETQQKSEDKSDNSAPADKNAKDLTLEKLPGDKDNSKYSTQSAYKSVTDSVVSIALYKDKITDNESDIISEGTGTIVSEDGYIVTNSHVIGDSKAYYINVTLNTAKEYSAKVVGYDTRTDLALIKIDAKGLSAVTFGDTSLVNVGDDIIVVGSPGGKSFQNSLTRGIVSAVDRTLPIVKSVEFIQTDAAINPGNSGGPMCNIYGQVIGINSAKIVLSEYEGMGFAIESNNVVSIVNDLMKYGYVKNRVRLGISGQEVSSETSQMYNIPSGIMIYEIDSTGPLANTNISQYDIITEVDSQQVSTFQDVYAILSEHKTGDKIKITVQKAKQ